MFKPRKQVAAPGTRASSLQRSSASPARKGSFFSRTYDKFKAMKMWQKILIGVAVVFFVPFVLTTVVGLITRSVARVGKMVPLPSFLVKKTPPMTVVQSTVPSAAVDSRPTMVAK